MSEITVTGLVGGKTLSFSTGKLAGQADGAVVVRLGATEMLVTAIANKSLREGIDFFPLTVDFEERMYAAGKIPGSFFRREGRPTEQAILTCRLIDRPLRPSFADGFRCETQVVVTTLAVDDENPFDVVALNGASAALMVSPIPFEGPVGGVRLALKDGEWIPIPDLRRPRRVGLRARRRRQAQRPRARSTSSWSRPARPPTACACIEAGAGARRTRRRSPAASRRRSGHIAESIDLQLELRRPRSSVGTSSGRVAVDYSDGDPRPGVDAAAPATLGRGRPDRRQEGTIRRRGRGARRDSRRARRRRRPTTTPAARSSGLSRRS